MGINFCVEVMGMWFLMERFFVWKKRICMEVGRISQRPETATKFLTLNGQKIVMPALYTCAEENRPVH